MSKLVKHIYSVELYDVGSFDYNIDYPSDDNLLRVETIDGRDINIITCNPLLAYKTFKDLNKYVGNNFLIQVSSTDITLNEEQFIKLVQKKTLTCSDYDAYIVKDSCKIIAYDFSCEGNVDYDDFKLIQEVLCDQINLFNMGTVCNIANIRYVNLLRFISSGLCYEDAKCLVARMQDMSKDCCN